MGRMNAKIDEAAAKEDHMQSALQEPSADEEADAKSDAGQQQGQ